MTFGRPTGAPQDRSIAVQVPVEREELFAFLELDQLVADTSRPVPQAALTRPVRSALWVLRVFVVIVSLMVIYTFIHQL